MSGQALIPAMLSWFAIATDLIASNTTFQSEQIHPFWPSYIKDVYSSFQTTFVQQGHQAQSKFDSEHVDSDFSEEKSSNYRKTTGTQIQPSFVNDILNFSSALSVDNTTHELKQKNLSFGEHKVSSVIGTTPARPFQGYVRLGASTMDKCFRCSRKLQLRVLHMEIFINHDVVESDDFFLNMAASRLQRDVDVVVPVDMVVKI